MSAPGTPKEQGFPSGTVTFLFSDIEGSTNLLQRLGDRYEGVLEEHRRLLRAAFQEKDGHEIDTAGDGFFVAFGRAAQAVEAAVASQREIAAHPWPEGASVGVRMGLHTGEPALTPSGYVGLDVHRAARISSAGHGGQILLSQTTRDLVENDLPDGVSLRDLGEHRLKDLKRPERIFQVVIQGLPADFPPLKSLNVLPNNLPVQLTSFIGREKEIEEVKRSLSATRLLTLTGAGGCGKTRLALQVASDLLEEYRDGVWLVELAALSDPALVPQAVASVLSLREEPGYLPAGEGSPAAIPILSRLSDHLRPKRMLIVLDNCEHLVEACASLAEGLLRACPNLRILATSREALGISGERAWSVPSLSLLDPKMFPSLAKDIMASTLTQYESVRLFIDRAVSALPTFTVTNRNAPAVAQICHRLDGIPLAIELAAARVKVLSAEQIALRLDDRFRLLTGGSRTALPRQQTLRATIDWSYNLLPEPERVLLRRLSAFVGGWTLPAAEAVCGDTMPPRAGAGGEGDVLDLLTQLVNKSLVAVEEHGAEARYRLLETVRQYSLERLIESGEAEGLRGRHRDWYLSLAERAEPELVGRDRGAWLDRLEAEHDNLRAALEWSLGSEGAEEGLRLAGALWRFWFVRGFLSEGRKWLEGAIVRRSGELASVRVKALNGAGALAMGQGDQGRAKVLFEESLSLSRELGDSEGTSYSLRLLGLVAQNEGGYGRATTLFEESLTLRRELQDKWGIAHLLRLLGGVAEYQGDYGRAKALLEDSLAIFRELGDKEGTSHSLRLLGLVAQNDGDYGRAKVLFEESLSLLREIEDKWGIAHSLRLLGSVAQSEGDYPRAAELYKESLILGSELGDKEGIARCLEGLGAVAGAEGPLEHAVRLYGAAEALREAIDAPLQPSHRSEHDRDVAALRAGLGEEEFTEAWAQGRAMQLKQAIDYALTGVG
jgi:predicted ATPase/class 3 adenylate cyclase